MRWLVVPALLSLTATPVVAQGARGGAAPQNPNVAAMRTSYEVVKGYITRSADKVPEEHYAFKPTPEVRSFGGIVGHIADANYMICSSVKGETNPMASMKHETLTTKADLAKAVKESFAYCDGAYGITDAQAAASQDLFGMKMNKLGVLAFNTSHDFEHYGNLVTYMRLKGIVPPSSEGGGGGN
jgi:uncharacterized damage-inducible protein DinB